MTNPLCGSVKVVRKAENQRVGRWNCHGCISSFNVLSGTIFSRTKIPLQKWFLGIALVVNAKESLSSYQLARDLELTQMSAWYLQQRIRSEESTCTAMAADRGRSLRGIIEADETYLGGRPTQRVRPWKRNRRKAVVGREVSAAAVPVRPPLSELLNGGGTGSRLRL